MFPINVWITVKDAANVEAVRGHLAEAARQSRGEPGCERFEVYQSEADASKFLLVERWASRGDWETHRTAHAFREIYQAHVLPLVDREPHICKLVE